MISDSCRRSRRLPSGRAAPRGHFQNSFIGSLARGRLWEEARRGRRGDRRRSAWAGGRARPLGEPDEVSCLTPGHSGAPWRHVLSGALPPSSPIADPQRPGRDKRSCATQPLRCPVLRARGLSGQARWAQAPLASCVFVGPAVVFTSMFCTVSEYAQQLAFLSHWCPGTKTLMEVSPPHASSPHAGFPTPAHTARKEHTCPSTYWFPVCFPTWAVLGKLSGQWIMRQNPLPLLLL